MPECPICFLEINEMKLVSPGCCSIKLCRDCTPKCNKCPQCKENFCWSCKTYDDIKELIMESNYERENVIYSLRYDLSLAKEDILQLSKSIKEKQKIILEKEMKINTLMSDTSIVNEKNEFESVVLRYHLNIQ